MTDTKNDLIERMEEFAHGTFRYKAYQLRTDIIEAARALRASAGREMVEEAREAANEYLKTVAPIEIKGDHLEFPPDVTDGLIKAILSAALSTREAWQGVETAEAETLAWNCEDWPEWLRSIVDETNEAADRLDMSSEQAHAYATIRSLAKEGK